jgi:NAD(P)-dependent dehydrogenase (short-subunit alcohol dehydrogenase family)
MACRSNARANEAIKDVRAQIQTALDKHAKCNKEWTTFGVPKVESVEDEVSLEAMQLDLSDLSSVRAFANAFLAKHKRLDYLILNAGKANTYPPAIALVD